MDPTPIATSDLKKQDASQTSAPKKYIRTFARDMEVFKKGGTPGLAPLGESVKNTAPPEPEVFVREEAPVSMPFLKPKPVREELPNLSVANPDEYIRTFAGDVEVFKKGGTPDLVPFKAHGSQGRDESALKTQAPAPEEEVHIYEDTAPTNDTYREPIAEPVRPVAPTPPPPPVVRKPSLNVLENPTPIETYTSDFQKRVQDTQSSKATILASEQDATKAPVSVGDTKEHRKNGWYIALGLVLLLTGGAGAYIAYTHYLVQVAPVFVSPVIKTPIPVESRVTVAGSGEELLRAFATLATTPIPQNTVELVSFDASTTALTTVFTELHMPAPDILSRDIQTSGTMAGVLHTEKTQAPFFILSVGAYSTTFSGMLAWEPTMQKDMTLLFPLHATAPVATTTEATSTSAQATFTVFLEPFHDETVQNHDVRVLRDGAGQSIITYGYWDEHTLILARDPEAFAEILTRLSTAHS